MSLKVGKTEVKKIAQVLELEWDSAEDAAMAVLDEALAILEARGRWVVVGQLRYSGKLGGYIDHEDAYASKVCLGLFSSKAEAERAATSLTFSTTTNESFLTWVIDVDHGTPHELFLKRREFHRLREIEKRKAGVKVA